MKESKQEQTNLQQNHQQNMNMVSPSPQTSSKKHQKKKHKSIPVEANGESTIKVPENASLQQSAKDFPLFLLQKPSRKFTKLSSLFLQLPHLLKKVNVSPLMAPLQPSDPPSYILFLSYFYLPQQATTGSTIAPLSKYGTSDHQHGWPS